MTENEEYWCKGEYQLASVSAARNYIYFLSQITFSETDPGKCSVPCKIKRYQAKNIGKKQSEERGRGVIVWFQSEVDRTTSDWQLDEFTFLSKIGGHIGISKNFLWVLIMIASSIGVCLVHLNKCKCKM